MARKRKIVRNRPSLSKKKTIRLLVILFLILFIPLCVFVVVQNTRAQSVLGTNNYSSK